MSTDLVQSIAQAIANMEGFNSAGSVAQRNNNPGNLRTWGNYPVVDGYAQFPDLATGWNALYSQIQTNIGRGLTLQTFFGGQRDASGNVIPGGYPGYSPSADSNNPAGYAQYVAGQVGISPTVPLNSLDPQQPFPPRRAKG